MTPDTPKPRSLDRRWQRAQHDAGLRHIKGRWVSKDDHARLQPMVDEAAARAAKDGEE